MCSFLTISPVVTTFPRNTGNLLEILKLELQTGSSKSCAGKKSTLKHWDGDMGKCRTFHTTFLLFLAIHLQLQPPFPISLTIGSTPQHVKSELKSMSQFSIWWDTGFEQGFTVGYYCLDYQIPKGTFSLRKDAV